MSGSNSTKLITNLLWLVSSAGACLGGVLSGRSLYVKRLVYVPPYERYDSQTISVFHSCLHHQLAFDLQGVGFKFEVVTTYFIA
jgi:hypothetical protein